ncbi:MAG: DUF559 domain-containing protein [Polyangiaceae bacterium]|nr:DUF559 domain-containing protein [Polyangiaceae bacterium]
MVLGQHVVDFLVPVCGLVIEVDGGWHRDRRVADARRDARSGGSATACSGSRPSSSSVRPSGRWRTCAKRSWVERSSERRWERELGLCSASAHRASRAS